VKDNRKRKKYDVGEGGIRKHKILFEKI